MGSCTQWMGNNKEALADKTLNELTLPGTHDAGAYKMNNSIMPGSIPPAIVTLLERLAFLRMSPARYLVRWAECQTHTITEQLNGGIRYLDLRSGWNGSEWVAVHTVQGPAVKGLLQEIKEFLDSTTHEVVVVEMYHLYNANPELKKELAEMVSEILGDHLAPRPEGDLWSAPLSWYWQMKRRLVLVSSLPVEGISGVEGVADGARPAYPTKSLVNTWADSDDVKKVEEYNDAVIAKFARDPNTLVKIAWTMTPKVKTVLRGIFCKPQSLLELAEQANQALPEFVEKEMAKGHSGEKFPQILIADDFQTSNIVPLTNRMNGLPECECP